MCTFMSALLGSGLRFEDGSSCSIHVRCSPSILLQAVHRELQQQHCSEGALLGKVEAFEDMASYCDDILGTGTPHVAAQVPVCGVA